MKYTEVDFDEHFYVTSFEGVHYVAVCRYTNSYASPPCHTEEGVIEFVLNELNLEADLNIEQMIRSEHD